MWIWKLSFTVISAFYNGINQIKFALEWTDKLWHSPTSQGDAVLLHWLPTWIWRTWKGHLLLLASYFFSSCLTEQFLWHIRVWMSIPGPRLKCCHISRQKLCLLIFFSIHLQNSHDIKCIEVILLLLQASVTKQGWYIPKTILQSFKNHVMNLPLMLLYYILTLSIKIFQGLQFCNYNSKRIVIIICHITQHHTCVSLLISIENQSTFW